MDGLVHDLLTRGWTTISLSDTDLTYEEREAVDHWEEVFGRAFALDVTEKEAAGTYRTENGVSVGYRLDSEREFFESRILSTGVPEPNFSAIPDYAATVMNIYSALNKVATPALRDIASYMGVDPQFFFDLTDIESNGVLPMIKKKDKETGEEEFIPDLSSSLLRICKYGTSEGDGETESVQEKNTWFGAHTDSSFFTVALCSSTPGLDIVDQLTNQWVCPELTHFRSKQTYASNTQTVLQEQGADVDTSVVQVQHNAEEPDTHSSIVQEPAMSSLPAPFVVLFVGEFLQVLSKNRFKAAVHRVRNFGCSDRLVNAAASATAELSMEDTSESVENKVAEKGCGEKSVVSNVRISCPYLIRGRHGAVIDLHNTDRYNHPGGEAAIDEAHMPNLDGTSVRMLHKLLDLKRQKCFRDNGSAEGSWVLSAYPVPPLPPDN